MHLLSFTIGSIFLLGVVLSAQEQQKNFAPELSSWQQSNKGFMLVSTAGPNGTPAIYYSRKKGEKYTTVSVSIKDLKRSTKYKFGAWVRTKNVTPGGIGASTYMEYTRNGIHATGYGSYPSGITGTQDWTLITGETLTPPDFSTASLGFYIRNNQYGEAWFAAPFIYEAKTEWNVNLVIPKMRFALVPGKHVFVFNSLYSETDKNHSVQVALWKNKKKIMEKIVPIDKGRFSVTMDLPKNGWYEFHLRLVGDDIKENIEKRIALNVPQIQKSSNSVIVDKQGRTLINGKKFLPIGLFFNQMGPSFTASGNYWRQEEFDNLKDSPFNCIMPYDAMLWKRKGSPLKGLAETCAIMDELNRIGIKVIFSLKDIGIHTGWDQLDGHKGVDAVTRYIVGNLRNHPALLAWYLNDEQPAKRFYREQRERIARLDPWHPTWQCHYNVIEMPRVAGESDIFGVDPYPISDKNSDMSIIKLYFENAKKIFASEYGTAIWGVIQIFSFSNYDKKRPYYLPTESQIRSMSLFMALLGSKGFIFYAYHDQLRPEMLARKDYSFPRRWQELCRVAQLLKDLSRHLLSDSTAPATSVRKKGGDVHAASFTDDSGNTATLIVAIGPGKSEAVIAVEGKTNLKSKYGKTKPLGDGKYLFKGEGIDSDVLME